MTMDQTVVERAVLLGDEAVALAAIHAGITAAYAYPGTPSTEIFEYLLKHKEKHGAPHAAWCANEKTALEEALGTSFSGRRAIVSMKHVGLNVAADPFVNGAIVSIQGGLVIAVADDPGMHSSQNEQDSRYLADFAKVICLEPADQQEAYEMTREAFDLSERYQIPVVVRLVTRLAHSRAIVDLDAPRPDNEPSRVKDKSSWILLPANARKQWDRLLDTYASMMDYAEVSRFNKLDLQSQYRRLGVITTGVARNYLKENVSELAEQPNHLHIGAYPIPAAKIRRLAKTVDSILVLEDGYPYVERLMRGIFDTPIDIMGKMSGEVPASGELTPDVVRRALGLDVDSGISIRDLALPSRPPQLCQGCPHGNAYQAITSAIAPYPNAMVTSDIGCYTLGALPPHSAIETCVCMGASIGIGKGASEAGVYPVIAVIGDSTFLHSGVTPLMDCITANANMTIVILDNETVAMTGTQPSILPSSSLESVIRGCGVDPEHLHVVEARPQNEAERVALIQREIEYHGLSVIVMYRECLEKARKRKQQTKGKQ